MGRSIGGRIGEEFRKALKSTNLLHEYIKKHPIEAKSLVKSYQAYFNKPHPQLSQALSLKVSKKESKPKTEEGINATISPLDRSYRINPLTGALAVILILTLGSGVVGFQYLYNQPTKKDNNLASVAGISQEAKDPSEFNLTPLENPTLGYKLSYPKGWNVMSLKNNEVEISPPTSKGKIIVRVDEGIVNIDTELENLTSQEMEIINKASAIAKDTFEFIEAVEYDKNEIRKRFIDAKREVN